METQKHILEFAYLFCPLQCIALITSYSATKANNVCKVHNYRKITVPCIRISRKVCFFLHFYGWRSIFSSIARVSHPQEPAFLWNSFQFENFSKWPLNTGAIVCWTTWIHSKLLPIVFNNSQKKVKPIVNNRCCQQWNYCFYHFFFHVIYVLYNIDDTGTL